MESNHDSNIDLENDATSVQSHSSNHSITDQNVIDDVYEKNDHSEAESSCKSESDCDSQQYNPNLSVEVTEMKADDDDNSDGSRTQQQFFNTSRNDPPVQTTITKIVVFTVKVLHPMMINLTIATKVNPTMMGVAKIVIPL